MAKRTLIPTALALLLAPMSAELMAEQCFSGSAADGELRFRGEAEGNRFNGQFREFTVRLCRDNADEDARIEVLVATASATVGNRQGDQALQDEELFFVSQFPEARWAAPLALEPGEHMVEGELSLRGVSLNQPVSISVEINDDVRLSGTSAIARLDYGVGQGEFADPDFIRDRVDLSFDVRLSAE